jgi:hypothetical protein
MTPLYIAAAIALICFILYALDRRMNSQPIDWPTALKICGVGAVVSGGISYSIVTPEIAEVAKVVVPVVETAQEIFVGTPNF